MKRELREGIAWSATGGSVIGALLKVQRYIKIDKMQNIYSVKFFIQEYLSWMQTSEEALNSS